MGKPAHRTAYRVRLGLNMTCQAPGFLFSRERNKRILLFRSLFFKRAKHCPLDHAFTVSSVKMINHKNPLTFILLTLHLISPHLFHPILATLDSSSCTFPNGQQATGFIVCDPTAAQSSCCLEGEACLQNGLCYGAIGLVYRGACTGFALYPSRKQR